MTQQSRPNVTLFVVCLVCLLVAVVIRVRWNQVHPPRYCPQCHQSIGRVGFHRFPVCDIPHCAVHKGRHGEAHR